MAEIVIVRHFFLRGICLIYWFAFSSLYLQIPGLYGNNGILPARNHLQDTSARSLIEKIHKKPTLLWFAPFLGLNIEYMMDILCLFGMFLSFNGFASLKFATVPIFAALWSLYFSLYQVGQTFMSFQWDSLLLEVGFLSILVAPWPYGFYSRPNLPSPSPSDNVRFFLIKWLFFRLTFSSGVIKLQSGCPKWWDLTALEVHLQSQPLPTDLAWRMYYLPTWIFKTVTAYTLIVEQIMPFLFFFPLLSVRVVGFFLQVVLQVWLIAFGNYNFFNFLTILLSLSLLDDRVFGVDPSGKSVFHGKLNKTVNCLVHGFILFIAVVYYGVRFTPKEAFDSKIMFTKAEFDQFLKLAVPAGIYLGGVWLLIISVQAVLNSFKGTKAKFSTVFVTLLYISAAYFLFGISSVPYSALHKSSNSTIIPSLRKLYGRIEHLQIANSYGLFRRMTGVGARPEVIIEGSNDLKGPWIEYHFKYKPGDVNSTRPFVVPHQPRLDWQLWFAALGTYHQNPWLMSTAYRILEGEKSVIQLLDTERLPFSKPPKYLKASLYHYNYSPRINSESVTRWKRELVGEYFPIFTKDHTPLVDYLKTVKILDSRESLEADNKLVNPTIKSILDALRNSLGQLDPFFLVWAGFTTGLIIAARDIKNDP